MKGDLLNANRCLQNIGLFRYADGLQLKGILAKTSKIQIDSLLFQVFEPPVSSYKKRSLALSFKAKHPGTLKNGMLVGKDQNIQDQTSSMNCSAWVRWLRNRDHPDPFGINGPSSGLTGYAQKYLIPCELLATSLQTSIKTNFTFEKTKKILPHAQLPSDLKVGRPPTSFDISQLHLQGSTTCCFTATDCLSVLPVQQLGSSQVKSG